MHDQSKLADDRLQRWLRQLHSPDEDTRTRAALRLTTTEVDTHAIIPALQQALLDFDPEVRKLAAWCLARLGNSPRLAA